MKKGVRIGLGILLALILVFGAGNLLYAYIQTGENAQASQEARDLVDIPEPDPPMAELPGYSNAPQQSDPVWVPAEERAMQQTGDPGFDDPVARNLLDIGLEKLQRENPDVVAWIVIPDTPISYPVLQGTDNAFYLKHNWKKERNSGGSIFMECKNNPDFTDFNTLVYGHRMRDSSMFNALRHYEDADFLTEHSRVYIVTNAGVLVYEVFACGKVTITDPVYWLITDQEQYKKRMIDFCVEYSAVDTGIVPATTSRLLTLSTCTSVRGSDNRWVVVARQIGVIERTATEPIE